MKGTDCKTAGCSGGGEAHGGGTIRMGPGQVRWSLPGGHLRLQWVQKVQQREETGTQLVTLVRPGHVGHFLEEVLVCERSVAWKGRSVVFCER